MGDLFQLGVTFGRCLALFALGLIAAVWLQWSWLYWLLAAVAAFWKSMNFQFMIYKHDMASRAE